jgi:GTP-binding protein LepA
MMVDARPGRDRLPDRLDQGGGRCRVGDTITEEKRPTRQRHAAGLQAGGAGGVLRPLPGRCGDFEDLRDAMEQAGAERCLLLFEMETSAALGFGFRCGFLGLLHLEIIRERLEREYNVDLITTAPSVVYKIT